MTRRKQREASRPGQDRGIAIDAPDAPEEGSDAGSDADLRARYRDIRIRQLRARAKGKWQNARRMAGQRTPAAESEARAAIDAAVRAFWWAEETEQEDSLHRLMHEIGRWTRDSFGCRLAFDGQRYSQRCPIDIAHKRMGMSIGFLARRFCSICGGDLSECAHIRGRAYWLRGKGRNDEECPVCQGAGCNHRSDRLYRVPVIAVVREADEVREVSVVGRPAQPEARLVELPVETDALRRRLGPRFRAGMEVSCDLCKGDCWGFEEFPEELSTVRRAAGPTTR